jgi:hypothetical protein
MPDAEKHTPGPWEIDIQGNYLGVCSKEDGEDEWYIAQCYRALSTKGEDIANARLMAAAPNMLAACKALIEATSPEKDSVDFCREALRASGIARHAIAKARGLDDSSDSDPSDTDERGVDGLTSAGEEVSKLRDENERLRERVADLEKACETADIKLRSLRNSFMRTPDPKSVARDARDILCGALTSGNVPRQAEVDHV